MIIKIILIGFTITSLCRCRLSPLKPPSTVVAGAAPHCCCESR
ncbi:hypothetical protein GLYMA_06G233251v4 [Glycine max]|nr:hypothetical protein GLYMA_06G233251v4 [Glycine max]KAH1127286.1 hypothetical protein GYH30_016025 [Glycine max]